MCGIQVGACNAHHLLADAKANLGKPHRVMQQATEARRIAVDHREHADPDAAAAAPCALQLGRNALQAHPAVVEPGLGITRHRIPGTQHGLLEPATTQQPVDEHAEREHGNDRERDGENGSVHVRAILRATPRYTLHMDVPEVNPDEAVALRAKGAAWIDVREQHEWDEAHIADTTHAPLQQSAEYVAANHPDPSTPIVVSCLSGGRSGQLVAHLREQGYTNVHNLRGGITLWIGQGRPVVTG